MPNNSEGSQPKLRPTEPGEKSNLSPQERKFVLDWAKGMQQALLETGLWKSCINCQHFSNIAPERQKYSPSVFCHKYRSAPPPEVIVLSCVDGWEKVLPF